MVVDDETEVADDPLGPVPKHGGLFTTDEWAVILPSFSPDEVEHPFTLPRTPQKRDEEDLPPQRGKLPDLSAFPHLQRAAAFDAKVLGSRTFLRFAVVLQVVGYWGCVTPLLATGWLYGPPRYSSRAVAAGFAALAWSNAVSLLLLMVSILIAPGQPAFYGWALEMASRWKALASRDSLLLEHQDDDTRCPCEKCAGKLPELAGLLRFPVGIVGLSLIMLAGYVAPLWSPIVVFADQVWTSPWAVPATIGFLVLLVGLAPGSFVFNPGSAALVNLSNRVQERAVHIALRTTFASLRTRLDGSAPGHDDPDSLLSRDFLLDLHSTLHSRLAKRWSVVARDFASSRVAFVLMFLSWTVAAIIPATMSGCIPAWVILNIVALALHIFGDLVLLATSNEGPERAGKLYKQAQELAQEMAGVARCRGLDVAGELRDFAAIAGLYTDVQATRARLWGFPIHWAFLRTLTATLFTLGVGMFTLIRSAGVTFTMETYCPVT
ncbi:hypothetical protein DFJ74DRAFT_661889 [Hyaloraphidium curvatum]|nr:hypothetical protein DFJ74DRAFT_661889 [Hyaloraphidium curvatum]